MKFREVRIAKKGVMLVTFRLWRCLGRTWWISLEMFHPVPIIQPELNRIRMHIWLQLFAYLSLVYLFSIIITTFPFIMLLNLSLIECCAGVNWMIEVVVHLPRFAVVQKATKLNFCLQTHQSPINTQMVEEHSSSLHITHYKYQVFPNIRNLNM